MPNALSSSQVTMWLKCPACWSERYIDKQKEPATGNLLFGRAMSEALEHLHRGHDYRAAFAMAYAKNARLALVKFKVDMPATAEQGLKLLDEYVLDGIYHGEPERKFFVHIKGLPAPLVGYMDLEERTRQGREVGIVEFKTSIARWDQARVDSEIQATFYWMAFWNMYRRLPHLTYVVMDLKALEVRRYETYRSREQCLEVIAQVNDVWAQMQKAHSDEGGFEGICQRHKLAPIMRRSRRTLILPTVDWDN